jgi:hypothetical protein
MSDVAASYGWPEAIVMARGLSGVELCRGLFDDASMFPPGAAFLPETLFGYTEHRTAWYGDMVGSLVCRAARLSALRMRAQQFGIDRVEVSMVVPEGLNRLPSALESAQPGPAIDLRSIEVPLKADPLSRALAVLDPMVSTRRAVFLEVGVAALTDSMVHRLAQSRVRLKLRTGATSLDTFQPETELARVLVLCAAERLAFKCSAGLHHAVRHRDKDTLMDHHGFLNIALAVRVAMVTNNVGSTRAVLAETDPHVITEQIRTLSASDVRAIRAILSSIATFNVTDSITDVTNLGLAAKT